MTTQLICKHCRKPIYWDDWSYVHADGIANCNAIFSGGDLLPCGVLCDPLVVSNSTTCAEPIGSDSR